MAMTLNQRVLGSSPSASTISFNDLASIPPPCGDVNIWPLLRRQFRGGRSGGRLVAAAHIGRRHAEPAGEGAGEAGIALIAAAIADARNRQVAQDRKSTRLHSSP